MPNEPALRPLTPRAECTIDGVYYSSLFETDGKMSVIKDADSVVVTTTGRLRAVNGATVDVEYALTHRFFGNRLTKEWTFRSPHAQVVRIVEPFVREPDLAVEQTTPREVTLRGGGRKAWTFSVERSPANCTVSLGENAEQYWSPFPAVNGYPVVVTVTTKAGEPAIVETVFSPAASSPAR